MIDKTLKVIIPILFIFLFHLPVFADLQEAKIKGIIKGIQAEGSKLPIAGILVHLEGATLNSNVPLTAISDENGQFTFFGLLPGDYKITIDIPGFEVYKATYKLVSGAISTINIDLKLKETTDVVDVKANTDEVSKTETSASTQLQEKTFRNAPLINEQFQDALPLLPGVIRGPDGLLNIKGARASQTGLLVNSTNVTDPVTGNFAISLPIEAIQSVTVLSNPFSAEYGKFTGAVTTINTRSGGDKWKFLFTNFFPRFRRRTDQNTGKSSIVGVESITPRLIATGPIIKDKLTISQSFQYQFIRTRVPSLPNLQNDTQIEAFDSFTQVDLKLNEKNNFTWILSVFPQNLKSVNLNTFNPIEVTPNFRQRGFFTAATERTAFSNGSLLEINLAVKRFNAFVFPQGNEPMMITPDGNFGNYFNRQDRFTTRYDLQTAYNLAPIQESHLIKIGTNVSYNTFHGRDLGNRVDILKANGTINKRIEFLGDDYVSRKTYEATIFVQDKFTIKPNIVLDFGMRYDKNGLSTQNNFAPRFGFVAVPFKNERTIVRGGVGLFYDKIPLGIGTFEQLQVQLNQSIKDTGITFLKILPHFIENPIQTPYSIASTIEVDHQFSKQLFLRLGFQSREGRNEFIVNPANSSTRGPSILLSNKGISRYREIQLTTKYKIKNNSDITFSYVRSKATGDLNDFNTYFGNFRTPIIRNNERSRQPFDAPNRFLTVGNFELPFSIVASPVVDIHTGFPFSYINEKQVFVGQRNANNQRFLKFLSVDLQVTKAVNIPFRDKKFKTRIGVKIFNLTNHFNPRDVQANIDSLSVGTFYNSVGRTFRGKFEFDF